MNFHHVMPPLARDRRGFTLVEVSLAIGVVAFALLAIVGSLPVGLGTVRDSLDEAATANIARHLQGELQQLSFNPDGTGEFNISNLPAESYYFTQEGIVMDADDAATPKTAHSKVTFSVSNATVTSDGGAPASFLPQNARNITVTLRYPQVAPEENQQTTVFSLFAAKQKSN